MSQSLHIEKIKTFYQANQKWLPVAFFVGGFIFDMLALERIDSRATLIQQSIYLVVSGCFISLEFLEYAGSFQISEKWQKLWKYREHLIHFLLGTLLNSFTIFYFKSASIFSSFIFLGFLSLLIFVNELRPFEKSKILIRWSLFCLSVISFFISFVPILLGRVGVGPFCISLLVSTLAILPLYAFLRTKLKTQTHILRTQIRIPYFVIQLLFAILYFAKVIPPVPLAIAYMGIYHDVKKVEGRYELSYQRPSWKFWQHGDQTFSAREGDRIYCFARIFSPARFNDRLQIRWFFKNEAGNWQSSDAIPFEIAGGRDEGYRGSTYKANYHSGDWRVQIETTDSRELGRIYFTVMEQSPEFERENKIDIQ